MQGEQQSAPETLELTSLPNSSMTRGFCSVVAWAVWFSSQKRAKSRSVRSQLSGHRWMDA